MIVKYGGNVSRPCKTRSLFPQSGNVTGISNSMFPSSLQSTDSRNVKWPVSENQCACDISFHTLPLVCFTAVLLWGVALCGNTIKNSCEVGYSASELSMNCIDSKLACCLLNILRASPHKCGWPGWPGVRDLAFFFYILCKPFDVLTHERAGWLGFWDLGFPTLTLCKRAGKLCHYEHFSSVIGMQ